MILIHNGIVRGLTRNGHQVERIRVKVNWQRLSELLEEARQRPGIVAVEASLKEGEFRVGEDLMYLVVAGDFRQNVLACLSELLEAIKAEVTEKEEIVIAGRG